MGHDDDDDDTAGAEGEEEDADIDECADPLSIEDGVLGNGQVASQTGGASAPAAIYQSPAKQFAVLSPPAKREVSGASPAGSVAAPASRSAFKRARQSPASSHSASPMEKVQARSEDSALAVKAAIARLRVKAAAPTGST